MFVVQVTHSINVYLFPIDRVSTGQCFFNPISGPDSNCLTLNSRVWIDIFEACVLFPDNRLYASKVLQLIPTYIFWALAVAFDTDQSLALSKNNLLYANYMYKGLK